MNGPQDPELDEPVYMVAGDDHMGDHHIFVTTHKGRARDHHHAMLKQFKRVKANWIE